MPLITDKFAKSAPNASTLLLGDHTSATTTIAFTQPIALPTTTPSWVTMFVTDATGTVTSYESVKGIYIAGSNSLTQCVRGSEGTAQAWPANTKVFATVTAGANNDLIDGLLTSMNLDGTLKSAAVQTALGSGTQALNGYNALPYTFNSVTHNGNRNYTCVINSQDLTGTLSPGMRIRTQRTVSAPTQSTLLDGSTKYWSKTSPAGMTFTNLFTCTAHIKQTAYGVNTAIISRDNGTGSGFGFRTNVSGQLEIYGQSGGNGKIFNTYQSIPLNRWVHVAATCDLATGTANFYIDGVFVPATGINLGTGGTALAQAGDLQIGKNTTTANYFPGKIAQASVWSVVLSQASINSFFHSQSFIGNEASLVSAYSFNGNATDLNTTNANNLTSNGGAGYTADSPFGGQGNGTISATLDYGIVQSVSFSTNTTVVIQCSEGNTIPTLGGLSSVAYSSNKVPYNFPAQRSKWQIITTIGSSTLILATTANVWLYSNISTTIPIGAWITSYKAAHYTDIAAGGSREHAVTLSTSTSTETNSEFTTAALTSSLAANALFRTMHYASYSTDVSVATIYYLLFKEVNTINNNQVANANIIAENAYL